MAAIQLQLPTHTNIWKLDRKTIRTGKAGLASARSALEAAMSIEDELALAEEKRHAANTLEHVLAA